ncbi:hypothetical protein LOK49_LG01G02055 [Camellia lanceoleosa]|uniref:Uncharacterized protein n=1 Tax=Camellia lanceoleosa TaxID=1840588 RepID=A0ACC0IVK2_9ERIC|nr:hypothetical protein LOK49_LG01G02055 [Camellia lanceoleosa]
MQGSATSEKEISITYEIRMHCLIKCKAPKVHQGPRLRAASFLFSNYSFPRHQNLVRRIVLKAPSIEGMEGEGEINQMIKLFG